MKIDLRLIFLVLFAIIFVIPVFALTGSVNLVKPVNDTYTNKTNDTLAFEFNFVDPDNETASCELFINDEASGLNETTANDTDTELFSNDSFVEGLHSWYVNCTNTTSITSETWNFTFDETAPEIPSLGPRNGSYVNAIENLSTNVTDTFGINTSTWSTSTNCGTLIGNSSACNPDYTSCSFIEKINTTTVSDGPCTYNFTIADFAGNLNFSLRNYTVDNTPPTLELNLTNNGTISPSNPTNITLEARDNYELSAQFFLNIFDRNSDNSYIRMHYGNTSNLTSPLSYYFHNESWNAIGFKATNGTVTTDTLVTVYIDYNVSDVYITFGYYNNTDEVGAIFNKINLNLIQITGNETPLVDGINFSFYNWNTSIFWDTPASINVTPVMTLNQSTFKLIETIVNDSHDFGIEAWVEDLANNLNNTNKTAIAAIPPIWSNNLTNPTSPATYAPNKNYQFNITWTDTGIVNTVLFEWNGTSTSVSKSGDVYYKNLTNLAAGNYSYKWYANDTRNASNNTILWDYTVDKNNTALQWSTTSTSVSCLTPSEIEIYTKLYRNNILLGSLYDAPTSAGTYNYICNTTNATQNYTIQFPGISHTLIITDGGTGTGTGTGKVEETRTSTGLQIIDYTTPLSITAGESKSTTFAVKNGYEYDVIKVGISLTGIPSNWYSISPTYVNRISLLGGKETISVTYNIPADAEAKDYSVAYTAEGQTGAGTKKSASKTITLSVKAPAAPAPTACPTTVPNPGNWSACVNGTRSRANYYCNETSGYKYVEYTEEDSCGLFGLGGLFLGIPASTWQGIIVGLAVIGFFAYVFRNRLSSLRGKTPRIRFSGLKNKLREKSKRRPSRLEEESEE